MTVLRRLFLWLVPPLVLLIVAVCGFLYWVAATQPGTRWALITAAEQFDGQARGISGTLWTGLQVDDFSMTVPKTVALKLGDFRLQVQWRELWDRRLHVAELSAGSVDLDLLSDPDAPPSSEPFRMPALPVRVAVDRFAVGELHVSQDGKPVPLRVGPLSTALALDENGGQLVLQRLDVEHEMLRAELSGEVRLQALQDPWPMQAQLTTRVVGRGNDSPLCASRYVSTLPARQDAGNKKGGNQAAKNADAGAKNLKTQDDKNKNETAGLEAASDCTLDIETTLAGTLDALKLAVNGAGQGMSIDVDANLAPRAAFPLKDATAALHLADGSLLESRLDWTSEVVDTVVQDRLQGTLKTEQLDIGRLVGTAIPPAVVNMAANFDVQLHDRDQVRSVEIAIDFADGTRWNKEALSGRLSARIVNEAKPGPVAVEKPESATGPGARPEAQAEAAAEAVMDEPVWKGLQLAAVDMDLRLGRNRLRADGSLGTADSRLKLDLAAPQLAAFWPDLPGGAQLRGEVSGVLASHKADLTVQYTPAGSKAQEVGSAPAKAHAVLEGGWGPGPSEQDALEGWRGIVKTLDAEHAGLGVKAAAPARIAFLPSATAPAWQWQVGDTRIDFLLSSRRVFTLDHKASRGGAGRWETQGAIARLPVSPRLIADLRKKLDPAFRDEEQRGGVKIKSDQGSDLTEIVLALDWKLAFSGALEGQAHIARVSGDLMVPAEPAFPLGLQELAVDLVARKAGNAVSRLSAEARIVTREMGRVSASASTLLHASPGGGLFLNPKDVKAVKVDADIDDLGWTSLLLGDAMELGGAVQARVQLQSKPDGSWDTGGTITGSKIRVVRVDDGIRLLDGTLSARLQGDRLILDKLAFPAILRVTPKEWRTAEWVSTNPDAKGGSLTLSGDWNLFESRGLVNIDLYRYPLLQRSDRYAMVSGKLALDAALPRIAIKGAVTADAGWFDLDMLGGIPTVDGDVVVLRPGETQKEVSAPTDVSMDLELDLGPRFYLTGYGVNSGLVGKLHVMMADGKLTAMGALRTRGGAIEAYGQRLQLRRGAITFQGDIASPVLDIEALRTGLAVEAGVRVAGTAKRPRIDLVSYPAVSEIEKLSWLLLGHGPNDSGGDVALLFSVGTSFLGSGEPFYRKFGVDEVSIRSGDLGAAGSILPAESVVSGLDSGTSDIERKFITVSKKLSSGITLSIQQALSDTGTVGRASYRLARGLTAEVTAGTVNGLALVYRWFSRD
ncbi:translocation/assembly module TamB domain-containing protein [Pollutimonas sp. H1-120]|uniref:translocation/assembly module TamB domain-containing protein n=1 Tax=Pollutimonas sp. H1-120 TaxID=3148824 RepID=UPI003B529C79